MSTEEAMRFDGQIAWAAGSGGDIGRACALMLAEQGAEVICIGRSLRSVSATVGAITALGGKASMFLADITDPESLAKLGVAHPKVDILVNCAAAAPAIGPTEQLSLRDWQRVIDTDLTGSFLLCRQAGLSMLKHGYGRIILLSSIHGSGGTYGYRSAYAASKAGCEALVRSLCCEWGGEGIAVNAVSPGPIETTRTQGVAESDPGALEGMLSRIPVGRLGEVDEVARLVCFLASREAAFVNGANFRIDGGMAVFSGWTS